MANRFVLNGVSYHGYGAIQAVSEEIKDHHFQKALVTSDPDLINLGSQRK